MRIISGRFKGKSIEFLKTTKTRPLKDSVKESIFNILNHSNKINLDFEKSNVLDLYSGIGSFGLECLSHGANKVTFVEKDKIACEILKKNLVKLSILNQAKILNDSAENILKKNNEKFDIFFFDPPFLNSSFIDNLKLIKEKKIFNNNHLIIIHREKNSKDNFKNILNPLVMKEYGRSKIIFGVFI